MQKRLIRAGNILNLTLLLTLSSCSTMKDLGNVNLWPFGKGETVREYKPANSVAYICEGNKKFFVRMLDKGASAWLILPDREVSLAQVGATKVYSNGISRLDLTTADVTLQVNETTQYKGCQLKTDAMVNKALPKVEAKAEVQAAPAPVVVPAAVIEPVKEAAKEPVKVEAVEPVAVVEAPQATPAAESTKDVEAASDNQEAVAKAVDDWANAWRTKNVNAYLNFYAAQFKPEGVSKKVWIEQRKQRVGANPAEITLTLDKLNVIADAKKATATFTQHYASGKYSDDVVKVLSFENIKGQWLIVKESAKAASAK